MVVTLGVEAMYAFMHSKPNYIVRGCPEPEYRVLPAVYDAPIINLNTTGPTRELPPRTNSRYDIRPEMPVRPSGILDDVVYDMDDTGVYHPNAKKARALEKELGIGEDKEAVKKRKQRMMSQQRAQKNKEEGGSPTAADHNVAGGNEDSDNIRETKYSMHVYFKPTSEETKLRLEAMGINDIKLNKWSSLSSSPGADNSSNQAELMLRVLGFKDNKWPSLNLCPAADISSENIITTGSRFRKAALLHFGSESDDQGEHEFSDEVDDSTDDHHDEDWKAPGKRVQRHRLTGTGVSNNGSDIRTPYSNLANVVGAKGNDVDHYTFDGTHLHKHLRENTIHDDPGPSKDGQKLYCICKQPEQGFMIQCEGPCDNWYHGTCVGITARMAEDITKFICQDCKTIRDQGDATVGQSISVANSHEHPVQSYHEPTAVNTNGAGTQQDLVNAYHDHLALAYFDLTPVNTYGSASQELQTAGTYESVKPGEVKIITNRLAQPVQFNCKNDSEPFHGTTSSCHWCEGPAYAVLGLPKKTYPVRELPNLLGYHEIDGGHRSEGFPASRMCVPCTSKRVNILHCPTHFFEPLPDNEFRANCAAAVNLERGELTGNEDESQWCSVCPEPAMFKCYTSHRHVRNGCGLRLCGDCTEWCTMNHNGDFEAFLVFFIAALVKTYGGEWEGIRPDAVFLLRRGELATRLSGGQF